MIQLRKTAGSSRLVESTTSNGSHIPVPSKNSTSSGSSCQGPVRLQERIAGLQRSVGRTNGEQQQLHREFSQALLRKSSSGSSRGSVDDSLQDDDVNKSIISVAAQRAAFERLEASTGSVINMKSSCGRSSSSSSSSMSSSMTMGSIVIEPGVVLRRKNSSHAVVHNNVNNNSQALDAKWRNKFEDTEKKRKMLLHKSEAGEI